MKTTIYTLLTKRFPLLPLLLSLLTFLFACCSSEENPETDGSVPVDIDLNIYLSLKSAVPDDGTPQERLLTSLRVYVFHKNGYLDNIGYAYNASGLTGDPEIMQMTVYSGDKTFCVIGNEPSSLTSSLQNIKNLWDLQALIMNDDFNLAGALLPFASTEQETITPGHTAPVRIGLQRAVAKAEMKIIKDASNTDVVRLISAQIINTPDRSRLMDGIPPGASSVSLIGLPAESFSSLVVGSSPSDTLRMVPLYLFEHLTGTGDAVINNATMLKVELDINGTQNIYNIPLRVEDSAGQKMNDVIRNYIYRMRLTVYSQSIRIDYTISPWEDEAPWDKEAGGDDSNMEFTDWDDEPDYPHVLPVP